MQDAHNLALFTLVAACGVGALLLADAAEEAARAVPTVNRRRAMRLIPSRRFFARARPTILHCVGLGLLGGMTAAGTILIGTMP